SRPWPPAGSQPQWPAASTATRTMSPGWCSAPPWDAGAGRRRSPRPSSFWYPPPPASSTARYCQWMAAIWSRVCEGLPDPRQSPWNIHITPPPQEAPLPGLPHQNVPVAADHGHHRAILVGAIDHRPHHLGGCPVVVLEGDAGAADDVETLAHLIAEGPGHQFADGVAALGDA